MSAMVSAGTTGLSAPSASLAHLFLARVAASPDSEAFRFPTATGWASVTWRQVNETVKVTAAGLLALDVQLEDRVAIASSTRVEWLYADLAIMCAGAATTTVYPTTTEEEVAFIVSDSGSRIAFAEDDQQIARLRAQRDHLPDLRRVVTFDGTADGEWVLSFDDLQALGARLLSEHPSAVDDAVAAVRPEHLATLIYTSGTTGRPKGVELPHRCWTYIGAAARALDIVYPSDLQYLWLPLSHSFGKMLEAVQLQVGFSSAVDGRVDRIAENLPVIRPTFMAGPPRIFEKLHSGVVQTVEEQSEINRRVFSWAFGVGLGVVRARLAGRRVSPWQLAENALADRLVFAKIRARLGGRIRFLLSGSAAVSTDVVQWFRAAGLVLVEGYGLTETSAAACITRPEECIPGVVGPAVPGTELRLGDDGEILLRGPGVMRGYHNLPQATAEVMSSDGWLATGDIGELDDAGWLRVTDRKKDLIKTSNGKYIAPQAVEGMFKAVCPLVSHVVVHGDGRKYATALISLDPDALARWARAHGITGDHASLTADPAVHAYVSACVAELNGRLNRWETVKDFRILDHDLSVEEGLLTPSMKVKRKLAETRFSALLDSMYDSADQS